MVKHCVQQSVLCRNTYCSNEYFILLFVPRLMSPNILQQFRCLLLSIKWSSSRGLMISFILRCACTRIRVSRKLPSSYPPQHQVQPVPQGMWPGPFSPDCLGSSYGQLRSSVLQQSVWEPYHKAPGHFCLWYFNAYQQYSQTCMEYRFSQPSNRWSGNRCWGKEKSI